MVAGCLAQKDQRPRAREGALRRRRARHAQRAPQPPSSSRRPDGPGPITEILDEAVDRRPRPLPVGAAGPARQRLQRVGHDPDRLRQHLRVLHRPGRARPRDQPTVRRRRRRGGGPRRGRRHARSPCSARTSTATAGISPWPRARPATPVRVRPLFAELLRAVAAVPGIRRVRFTSPAPEGPARRTPSTAMADDAGRVRAPPPPAAGRLATGRWPRCTAGTPRAATSTGWPRPVRAVPDLAVSTDIIVGFPGETDDDFAQTLEVVAAAAVRLRLHVHLLAPAGHRGGRR